MKRTSVLIDVEDPLYYDVIEPMKRNKSFTKLVVSLLNGYNTDRYIRAYIDDTLEEVHRAVVGSFESSVCEMESVLSNMGLLTDELKGQALGGYQKFKEHAESTTTEQSECSDTAKDTEVANLKARVNTLEKTISDGFDSLMKQIQNMSVCQSSVAEVSVNATQSTTPVIKKVVDVPEPVNEVEIAHEPEPTVEEGIANSFLSNLVADFSSF